MELTPDLANVHCENCHGAGLAHLADQQAQYSKDAAKSCSKCHIEDFSPDFQYGPYWMKIAHR
jgi:DnaJ-class molecular chaperone